MQIEGGDMKDRRAMGNGGFAKIYGNKLAESSLLFTDVATRWVFVYMLAQADYEGVFVCQSLANLALKANVTREEAQRAIDQLQSEDKDSFSKEEDGRRIVRHEDGWQIVNYKKYRDFQTVRQIKMAEYQRAHRAKTHEAL
jgi:hypothetical protein